VLERPADAAYPSGRLTMAYTLRQAADAVDVDVFDNSGSVVAGWSGSTSQASSSGQADRFLLPAALTRPGTHALTWDLHASGYLTAAGPEGPGRFVPGPLVPPGLYVVQLRALGLVARQAFKIVGDPAIPPARQAVLDARFGFSMQVRGRASAASAAIKRLRAMRARISTRLKTTTDKTMSDSGEALLAQLARLEGSAGAGASSAAGLVPLHDALQALMKEVEAGGRPSDVQTARLQELSAGLETQVVVENALVAGSFARFERGEAPAATLSGSEFGAAVVVFDSKGWDLSAWLKWYMTDLKKYWLVPRSAAASRGHVTVALAVRKSGVVTGIDVVAPCDVAAFNDSARDAVFAARPAPPLPDGFPDETLPIRITFYFNENPLTDRK